MSTSYIAESTDGLGSTAEVVIAVLTNNFSGTSFNSKISWRLRGDA